MIVVFIVDDDREGRGGVGLGDDSVSETKIGTTPLEAAAALFEDEDEDDDKEEQAALPSPPPLLEFML